MRGTRYQAAILRDHRLLLIQHRKPDSGRTFWTVPGGGREPGESEEACVAREVLEETHLEVAVDRLLLHLPDTSGGSYRDRKTYLCRIRAGKERPGVEPTDTDPFASIVDVAWLDLRDEIGWMRGVAEDPITYPLLRAVREALGYA